jgi:DNA-binding CsgD family transcriptional regulator
VSFGSKWERWVQFIVLVGQGFSDRDLARKLDLTELKVQACIAWILHFLRFTNRNELIRYAAGTTVM